MVYNKARLQHALNAYRGSTTSRDPIKHPVDDFGRRLRTRAQPLLPITSFLWREEDEAAGYDNEEYNPAYERRRSRPSKPRNNARRRKAEDPNDYGMPQKKKRRKEAGQQSIGDHGDYTVVTFKTETGRRKLVELDYAYKARLNVPNHPGQAPNWLGKHANAVPKRKRDKEVKDLMDMDVDIEPNITGNLCKSSLRSGKVIEHKSLKFKCESDGDVSHLGNVHVAEDGCARSQTKISTGTSQDREGLGARPILIDDSSDDDYGSQAPVYAPARPQAKGSKLITENQRSSPNSSKSNSIPFRSFGNSGLRQNQNLETWTQHGQPAFDHHERSIFALTTSYAHPIDFKYCPTPGQRCEFCSDYRISILGYGKITISAFVDLAKPLEYQEAGDGYRSKGKPPTKMCIPCALGRLLIMRCHRQQDEDSLAFGNGPDYSLGRSFRRIANIDYSTENLNKYTRHLLSRTDAPQSKPIVPICSLCAMPAQWECCKYQKVDYAKRSCEVPAGSTTTAISGHGLGDTTVFPSVEDRVEAHLHSQSPLPSQSSTHRPPLQGCGLKLCKQCRDVIVDDCDGVLDKKKVWAHLRGKETNLRVRADVEWLIEGSLLERNYEPRRSGG